jgi:hypothetical protein
MRAVLIGVLMGVGVFMVSSCATVPPEPLVQGELRLLEMNFVEIAAIRQGVDHQVDIKFEADGRPEVTRACFYWSGDGPHCTNVKDVSYGSGIINVIVPAPLKGAYVFKAYVYYMRDGKTLRSNPVETPVHISP